MKANLLIDLKLKLVCQLSDECSFTAGVEHFFFDGAHFGRHRINEDYNAANTVFANV